MEQRFASERWFEAQQRLDFYTWMNSDFAEALANIFQPL